MGTVSIAGLDKAAVLAALFNASRPMGMGMFRARQEGTVDKVMSVEDARTEMRVGDDHMRDFGNNFKGIEYFDYLHGRPLKIDLSKDDLRVDLYDRDNGGPGSAAAIIEKLRA